MNVFNIIIHNQYNICDGDDIQVGRLPDLVEPGALGLNANAAVVCLLIHPI